MQSRTNNYFCSTGSIPNFDTTFIFSQMYAYFQWWSNQYCYLKTLLSLKTETEDVRQKLFPSLKVSRMSRLRSLVYTVTSVLDNRSGTSVQVQVHWYVRLKAERITTSAEQILSLIFTEHFFLQIYQIYSSEKMFCENSFIQFVLQRPLQRCSHSVTGRPRPR